MQISGVSEYPFWSYDKNADLPEEVVIRQITRQRLFYQHLFHCGFVVGCYPDKKQSTSGILSYHHLFHDGFIAVCYPDEVDPGRQVADAERVPFAGTELFKYQRSAHIEDLHISA